MNPVDMNRTIPRTDALMARLRTRMRFLLGSDVRVGADYQGWSSVDPLSPRAYEGRCRAVDYDGLCLYVFEADGAGMALLSGDMADDGGRIVADRCLARLSVPELCARVDRYMAERHIAAYDTEVGCRALWQKMAPRELVLRMARACELGRPLIR